MVKVSLLIKSPKTEVKDFVNVSCERENVKVNVSFRLVSRSRMPRMANQAMKPVTGRCRRGCVACLLACLDVRAVPGARALAVCRIN